MERKSATIQGIHPQMMGRSLPALPIKAGKNPPLSRFKGGYIIPQG